MKYSVAVICAFLLLVSTAFVESDKAIDRAPRVQTLVVHTTFYCDHYMQCESKPILEKELMLTRGVKSVTINADSMTISVMYNPKQTGPEKIRKVISNAGYDADSVKANPKAYEKLDECCKKK